MQIYYMQFQKCNFKGCQNGQSEDFWHRFFWCIIANVDFSGAKLKSIIFKNAKLINVDFSKALLAEDMNFENAKCENCIFPESR